MSDNRAKDSSSEKVTVTELKRSASAEKAAPAPLAAPAPAPVAALAITDGGAESPGDRNTVFGSLVTEDSDVVGLVAYSIYKQNKHDFLVAFSKLKGREPSETELAAYTMGESTPRRLAIYRHLAQATLDGRGPDSPAMPGGVAKKASQGAVDLNTKLLVAAILLLVATLGFLVARLGMTGAG